MWELAENSDCGAVGTVGTEVVLSGAKEVLLGNLTRRLGAVLDRTVASCSSDERSFEMLE